MLVFISIVQSVTLLFTTTQEGASYPQKLFNCGDSFSIKTLNLPIDMIFITTREESILQQPCRIMIPMILPQTLTANGFQVSLGMEMIFPEEPRI